jgi:hypothetical protein
MAPATPGLGERPTGARVVRRHLLRRGAPAAAATKRSAWFDPWFLEVRLFGPARLARHR